MSYAWTSCSFVTWSFSVLFFHFSFSAKCSEYWVTTNSLTCSFEQVQRSRPTSLEGPLKHERSQLPFELRLGGTDLSHHQKSLYRSD